MSAFSISKTDRGVALVTGASTGIGRATAKALKDAGFRVFGTSRRAVSENPCLLYTSPSPRDRS